MHTTTPTVVTSWAGWFDHVRAFAARCGLNPARVEHRDAPRAFPCAVETKLSLGEDNTPVLVHTTRYLRAA